MISAKKKAQNQTSYGDTDIDPSDILQLLTDCHDVAISRLPPKRKLPTILNLILCSEHLGLQQRGGIFLRTDESNTFSLQVDINLTGDTNHDECLPVAIYNEQSDNDIRSSNQDMFIYPGLDTDEQISTPIIFRNSIDGVLLLFNKGPGDVSTNTKQSLGLITNMISSILANDTALSQTKNIEHDLENQIKAMNEHAIISTLNTEQMLIEVNENFTQISGFTRDELLGGHFCIGLSDDQDEDFFEEINNTISTGNVWKGEICNRNINNKKYWTKTTIVPFLKHNTIYKFVVISTDVTETMLSRTVGK